MFCFFIECARTENSVKNHWNCSLKKKLYNYSASGSAANRPRLTVPPLQADIKGVTRDSTEANPAQKLLEAEENASQVDRGGSNRESSASGKASNIEILNDKSRTLTHVEGSSSVDDKPSYGCSAPPETSPRSSNRDACGDLEGGSSEWAYTGLCYEPIQREDLNIYLSTGRFPSSESYVGPPSRLHMKEAWDSYSRTRSILRSAAMSYRNMPSIIRKRAFQLLHKGVSGPDNGVGASNRGAAGDEEATRGDDDQVHTCVFLSQMSEGLKSLQPLNLWGFERESRDA